MDRASPKLIAKCIAVTLVVFGTSAACTLIVDGQTKDFSGTCQLQHASDNACGRCVTSKCQPQINANCAESSSSHNLASSLEACMENPQPGTTSSNNYCDEFLSPDAALQVGQSTSEHALRVCVGASCQTECTTCTDIDAGSGACGTCIMQSCGPLLNGNHGCCEDTNVRSGIRECTDPVTPHCAKFQSIYARFDGGLPDGDTYCEDVFANCVATNCKEKCP